MSHSTQPTSSKLKSGIDNEQESTHLTQRRIRHITGIQVRNLTPFPVRDAFASALSQPAEQSQFSTHGRLSDDLDVTVSKSRPRRISVNSIATHRSISLDEGVGEEKGSARKGRKASASRTAVSGGESPRSKSNSVGKQYSTPASAPTIRPHRPRTTSITPSISSHYATTSSPSFGSLGATASAPFFTPMLPDNSQTGLEKVVKSRLVETFLTITIPPPSLCIQASNDTHSLLQPTTPHAPSPPLISPSHSRGRPSISAQNPKAANGHVPLRKGMRPSSNGTPESTATSRRASLSTPKPPLSKANTQHVKSSSTSVIRRQGKIVHPPTSSQKSPMHSTSSQPEPRPTVTSDIPNYFSPINRPSTNPLFLMDPRSGNEFTEGTDMSGSDMKVELWGKLEDVKGTTLGKSDLKGTEHIIGEDGVGWKILDEWDIDLANLVPLPDDLNAHPSQLPSNSLLITLSPPGQTYYLPIPGNIYTRSPTPSTGYASDPESEMRKVRQNGEALSSSSHMSSGPPLDIISLSRRRHRRGRGGQFSSGGETLRTAGWQDLFKLVTLQSCILDNENSLSDIIANVDNLLEGDVTSTLRREVSERQARVEYLRVDHGNVVETANKLRSDIENRKEQLRCRKEILALAHKQHEDEIALEAQIEEQVIDERTRLLILQKRFSPTRTTLLSTLSSLFPIDLLSPPDLLYTILNVPLPIPLLSTDPAPPLILSTHKDVTEDTVATSLGYAAQVVQLLAAYLGKSLVYPVTCIGSRSLIRDGISAMVGPRMFPLFSKGVDTYRFEYGVFLLNKDIEMLMADRDLRALDMRHTLPNLKNLLLTLTDGEGAHLQFSRSLNSPVSSVSGLETPPRADSPAEVDVSTPRATDYAPPPEGSSPPVSGSTTPTSVIADTAKRSRPFLDLAPLTGFLRSRYPSSSQNTVKSVSESATESQEEQSSFETLEAEHDSGEDEDGDTRTIQGVSHDVDSDQEVKQNANEPMDFSGAGDDLRAKTNGAEKLGKLGDEEILPAMPDPAH